MSDLKPCPFCGEADVVLGRDDRFEGDVLCRGKWHVFCRGCRTEFGHFDSKEEAIKAWNNRKACYDCQMGGMPATEENMAKYGWVKERTCHILDSGFIEDNADDGVSLFECDACGGLLLATNEGKAAHKYCCYCGAKVVEP